MSDPSRGEFVKAGYLIKSPPEFKAKVAQWHRRWFLLMDSKLVYPLASRYVRLEYYQSEAEAKRLADPKGIIILNDCKQIANREPIKGHRFVFDICTMERVYHLAAESGEEKQDWMDTLNVLLFTSDMDNNSPGSHRRWSPTEQRSEVIHRANNSQRLLRPLSFTGQPSPKIATDRKSSRPLPPVPGMKTAAPNTSKKVRPLPLPPADTNSSGSQNVQGRTNKSPLFAKRRYAPPKPAPYRGLNPPCVTPPPMIDISEHYEVAVPSSTHSRSTPTGKIQDSKNLNEGLETNGDADYSFIKSEDDEYSVLESTNVPGFDPSSAMYSHLQDTSTQSQRLSSPQIPRRSRGFHTTIPSDDDDYSLLQH